ncbi:MAG: hypothetical protein QOI51_2297, partial [Nocardioidaceae bacterium]|nr:hypothetical protein [Nocardioidaceae bacterium]
VDTVMLYRQLQTEPRPPATKPMIVPFRQNRSGGNGAAANG